MSANAKTFQTGHVRVNIRSVGGQEYRVKPALTFQDNPILFTLEWVGITLTMLGAGGLLYGLYHKVINLLYLPFI